MSYFSNISNAVSTLIDGMKVTMGYFVRPRENVTLQYPDEVWPIPERNIGVGELDSYNTIRSKLHVNMDDCIGCKACERACPVDCIHIDTYRAAPDQDLGVTSNGTKIKLLTANFIIDMSECMFCDLCTPPCPEDCIEMTPDYQFIGNDNLNTDVTPEERWRDRDHLIYQFSKVPEEERQRLKAEAEEAAKAKALAMAAKKAAAEKAAEKTAPPSGEAAKEVASETSTEATTEPESIVRMEDIQFATPDQEKITSDAAEEKPAAPEESSDTAAKDTPMADEQTEKPDPEAETGTESSRDKDSNNG
ncbi:MAG: 4Fe-4S binding protein [Candidatus Marinimicrobia bacterium]|nr:4Fe-4S binding protein [Candidatus Neomarinimicrobiota bacterium]MCF7850452.1 4Fe-4S binding protein [Candidatus Neomarinimicrobiota bacterium]MCF7904970.1 4Fe-4S binding protein [Candidatus Neomarinimicrobiota bacterium]